MISSPEALLELQGQWAGVRKLLSAVADGQAIGRLTGSWPSAWADPAWNVPMLHAFSVLNDALLQLRDEGVFKCRAVFLGPLLEASADHLPWQDFALIRQGVASRNDVAHRGVIMPVSECRDYVEAIEKELVAWCVVAQG